MKSLLKRIIVSGTFALLGSFVLTFVATPQLQAKPAGYTSDGQPFWHAYPDEGVAPEPSEQYAMPPYGLPYESAYPDQSNYEDQDVGYYNWPWGWWGGWGWPSGFGNDFNFDMRRHHRFNDFGRFHDFGRFAHKGFVNNPALIHNRGFFTRHNAMNRNFTGHSAMVKSHQNAAIGGSRMAGAHAGFRGGGHGGGHR